MNFKLVVNGLFQKKIQAKWGGVGWGLTFLKKIPEIFFRFCCFAFVTEALLSIQEILQNCYAHWNFQDQNPRPMPWKFHVIFSWSLLAWKFHFFFIDPSGIRNFLILYSISLEISCLQLPSSPLFGFFWNGIAKLIKIDVTGVLHNELSFLVFRKKWNKLIALAI